MIVYFFMKASLTSTTATGRMYLHQSQAQICGAWVVCTVTTSIHELSAAIIVGAYRMSLGSVSRSVCETLCVAVTPGPELTLGKLPHQSCSLLLPETPLAPAPAPVAPAPVAP